MRAGGRAVTVEYDFRSLDILLNGVKTEAQGDFAADDDDAAGGGCGTGTRHAFRVPPAMDEAVLLVNPPQGGRGAPSVSLTLNGAVVPPDG